MHRLTGCLLSVLLIAACGGESAAGKADPASASGAGEEDLDACTLLTSEEIQGAAGWTPDTTDAKTYGTTATCNYMGPDVMKQSVVLVVARPAPKVSSSAQFAERRTKSAQSDPTIKMAITPIEDLGMPAVRSEVEGSTTPTVEAVVGGRVLGVTTSSFESAKSLAAKAAARLR